MWHQIYRFFTEHRGEFERRYHQRSNVEGAFAAMKKMWGETLRLKYPIARVNEILTRVTCHNLIVLIHEVYDHGLTPKFLPSEVR